MGVLACSRVIMKTALALAVAMFLVASVSAHGHRNKNNNNKNNKNKNNNNKNRGGKREERCGVQQYTVSEKSYKQECHEDYENKCSTVTEVTTKYEQVCATSYVESCATVTEVIRECHTASLPAVPAVPAYGHGYGQGHGHLYGHYTAPINECVEVPVHNKVCTKEPVEV